MKYTPEPWTYEAPSQFSTVGATDADDYRILEGFGLNKSGIIPGLAESNIKRAIACVNACEGINPEAVPALLDAMDKIAAVGVGIPLTEGRVTVLLDKVMQCKEISEAAIAKARP